MTDIPLAFESSSILNQVVESLGKFHVYLIGNGGGTFRTTPMIREVRRAGERVNFSFGNGRMTTVKATQLYEAVQEQFKYPTLKHIRRYSSISWKTYHNELVKNKGRLVGEDAED